MNQANPILSDSYKSKLITFFSCLPILLFGQLHIAGDVYIDAGAEMHVAVAQTSFDRGEVITDRSANYGLLSFADNSQWFDASNPGHVNGFVRSHHDDVFAFPIGHDGIFQPARIQRLDASSPVDFAYSHLSFDNLTTEVGIDKVSDGFYWSLQGSQPAILSLSWSAFSNIDQLTGNNLDNLGIAGFDGSSWRFIEAEVDANAFHDNAASSLLSGSISSKNPINLEAYTAFTLAALEGADLRLNISQGFTPNGDGINDTWFIENIERYPNAEITIFSRWGREIFFSPGNYNNNWNGRYKNNNEPVPDGSYAYVIDLDGDGEMDLHGWIYITR